MLSRIGSPLILFLLLVTTFPAPVRGAEEDIYEDPGLRTVAVWDFENTTMAGLGDITQVDYLVRAIPEMVVTKLVYIPNLKVVERVHLREALEELNLGSGALSSDKSKLKLGRISGAKYMIFGNFMAMGPSIQVSLRVVEVETSLMAFVDNRDGAIANLSPMLEELTSGVARSFSGGRHKVTRFGWKQNPKVWALQNKGLALLDKRQYTQAIGVFKDILKKHPDFTPAKRQIQMAKLGDGYKNGLEFLEKGKYQEAVAAFKEVLRQNPAFKPARNNLKKALKLKRQAR